MFSGLVCAVAELVPVSFRAYNSIIASSHRIVGKSISIQMDASMCRQAELTIRIGPLRTLRETQEKELRRKAESFGTN